MPRPFVSDLLICALVAGTVWFFVPSPGTSTAVAGYQVIATIASVVAAICSVALATQYGGRRATAFDSARPGYLRRVYVMTMIAALLGAALPVGSIFLAEKLDRLALVLAATALSLTITHCARLFWLFNSLLDLEDRDAHETRSPDEAPPVQPPQLAPRLRSGDGADASRIP